MITRVVDSENTSRLLHESLLEDPLITARAKLQSIGALCMLLIGPVVAFPYFQHGEVELGMITLLFGLIFLSIVPILKYTGEVWLATMAGCLALLGASVTGVFVLGGLDSYSAKWLMLPPVYALSTSGVVLGGAWFITSIGVYAWMFWAIQSGALVPILVFPEELMPSIGMSNFIVFSAAIWMLLLVVDASHLWLVIQLRLSNRVAERARDEAERTGQARARFLANMSHELRTPMNAVIGYTEIIEEELHEQDNHDFDEEIAMVLDSSKELISMISDLLEVTQAGSSARGVVREKIDAARVFAKVTDAAEVLSQQRGNTFLFASDSDALEALVLEVDTFMFERVLNSLIDNANKFTQGGAVSLVVLEPKAGEPLEIEVRDSGVGIATEDLERIWDDFVQVDDSSTREAGGMGLGLGMVRRYCELLEVECVVESKVGEGTTFTLRVPARWLSFDGVRVELDA